MTNVINRPEYVPPSEGKSLSRSGRFRAFDKQRTTSVFGKGKERTPNGEARIGLVAHAATAGLFRTTERDKQPASQVLTGKLLGDPVTPFQYLSNAEPATEVVDRLAPRRYKPKEES